MFPPVFLVLALAAAEQRPDPLAEAPHLARHIDSQLEKHWQLASAQPAAVADDAAFLRRASLDLVGRIPTLREAQAFAADRLPDKRGRAVRRLMESPEYALHLGRVLDDLIQGKYANDPEFVAYLRSAVAGHKSWERIFREVLLGPWDQKAKGADRFLLRRLNSLDDLTNDTARVFFGVNVSCAKCHDHPLVADWKQDHYFGMASFFLPTYEASKGRGKTPSVQEKPTGAMTYLTTKGEKRAAKVMFLSNRVVDEPGEKPPPSAKAVSRREQLVQVALEERAFFSRAIVNRLWAYFLGRGLVAPVDQMHSANPPAIAGLLEWLADDLAAHGYDLDRLIAGLVSSRTYQLASTRKNADEAVDLNFDRAALRPLTPHQFALSVVLAAGDDSFDQVAEPQSRASRYRELEAQAARVIKLDVIDPRTDRFQSSTGEALYLSNHAEVQKLLEPAGNNLAARLSAIEDNGKLVETAVWTVLSRLPQDEERALLVKWLEERKEERAKACSQLLWALLASAEFRFNH